MTKLCMTIGGDWNEGLMTVTENGHELHRATFTDGGISFRLVRDDAIRVSRGGSRSLTAGYARAENRSWDDPGLRYGLLGFRIVHEREET